jgi:hypothetical protein
MAAATAFFPLPSLARTVFSPTLDDVPLAPGLVASEEGGLVFETPEGRVVVVEARSNGSAADILAWYRSAMPALGWTVAPPRMATRGEAGPASSPPPAPKSGRAASLKLMRGGERLEVEVGPADEPGVVRTRFRFVSSR